MRFPYLTALAATLLPSMLAAQTFAGHVVDKASHRSARNVAVTLVPDTGSTSLALAKTSTDTLGIFYIDAPAAGRYRLSFSIGDDDTYVAGPFSLATDEVAQHEFQIAFAHQRVYWEFEVERQVAQLPGNRPPRYPDDLRAAGIEGEVLAQFVVDENGRALLSTFKILRATHPGFVQSVRDALQTMRFAPAEIERHKVPQLVQMPFVFGLNR